jgi:ABC-2 type transport system ATP-binding protein
MAIEAVQLVVGMQPRGAQMLGIDLANSCAPRHHCLHMIELRNLTKRYGKILAVDRLSLAVEPGEIFGFLGPNGAGKTTTIRMMMGLLEPTEGNVLLSGHDLRLEPLRAKSLCGFVPDRPHIYEKLTAREFLGFVAGLYGVANGFMQGRRDELLDLFDLGGWADELVESYSHGMKQRLTMAAALIHRPRILIIDEPMVGLDPRGARLLKRILRQLALEGVTVFMSTHSLEVAEECCVRVGIINQGRLIALGTVAELRERVGSRDHLRLESVFLTLTGGVEDERAASGLRA